MDFGNSLARERSPARGSESLGLAARIAVNPAVVADPSTLILYQPGTAAGDSTRPDFTMLQQLTQRVADVFARITGIGTVAAPFTGSPTTYLRPGH